MGRSSDWAIEEANRNEANEALKILDELYIDTTDEIKSAKLKKVIKLVEKFRDKHQPEPTRNK